MLVPLKCNYELDFIIILVTCLDTFAALIIP